MMEWWNDGMLGLIFQFLLLQYFLSVVNRTNSMRLLRYSFSGNDSSSTKAFAWYSFILSVAYSMPPHAFTKAMTSLTFLFSSAWFLMILMILLRVESSVFVKAWISGSVILLSLISIPV